MTIGSGVGIKKIIHSGCLVVCAAGLLTALSFPYGGIQSQRYLSQKLYTLVLSEFLPVAGGFFAISVLAMGIAWLSLKVFTFFDGRIARAARLHPKRTVQGLLGLAVALLTIAITLAGTLGLLKLGIGITHSTRTPERFVLALSALFIIFLSLPALRKLKEYKILPVVSVLFFLFFVGALLWVSFVKNRQGPNVVLVVVDTLRSDHTVLGKYGGNTTPLLKKSLVADGVSFDRCYANSSWTLPSIASLLTCQYPSRIGMHGMDSRLGPRWLTLAELLKNDGYHTRGIISHIFLKRKYGLSQGFDNYDEEVIDERRFNHFSVTSQEVTRKALEFIRKRRGDKFFLFLHYFDPHQSYYDHDKSDTYDGRFRWGASLEDMVRWIASEEYDERDIEYLRRCYDSEIRYTDREVERVFEELKRNGIYGQTVIVFTSDHGEEFVERGFQGHGTSLYDEQIRVPLVIKPAGDTSEFAGRRINHPVSNLDIFATLVRHLGIRRPVGLSGNDLLTGDRSGGGIFSELQKVQFGENKNKVCLIRGDWKLIKNLESNRMELYNLRRDPGEKNDLWEADPPNLPRLLQELEDWIVVNRGGVYKKDRIFLSPEERKRLKSLGYF